MKMPNSKRLTSLLNDYSEDIQKCIRCGFCNSVCPTSNASFSYKGSKTSRGRLVILQAIISNAAEVDPFNERFRSLIDYCFGCRRCLEVCPAGVRIPQLMWRIKHAYNVEKGSGIREKVMEHYGELEKLAARVSGFANWVKESGLGKVILEKVGGIDRRAPFPKFSSEILEEWIRNRVRPESNEGRLAYFIDVFTNFHEVELGKRAVEFLEMLGYSVVAPEQKEAGTLMLEEGLLEAAEKTARFNVDSFYREVGKGARVLTTSPAAYVAMKKDYPELLQDEKSRKVAEKTFDILEIVKEEVERGRIWFEGDEEEIVYHVSCFTKASGLSNLIKELLRKAGYKLRIFDECCGVAGIWGMKKEHYDEAADVGSRLFEKIRSAGLPVVSQSETCRLQIRHHTGARVIHPFEALLERMRVRQDASQA